MNKEKKNAALASVGLVALSIYVVACNSSPSFSPDDTKVLFPAFDPVTGVIGMSVYDREAGTSEMLFLLAAHDHDSETNAQPCAALLRGQWLASGKDVVIAYLGPGGGNEEGAITLSVIPCAGRKPVKTLLSECGTEDTGQLFLKSPLCVAGERLFYRGGPDQLVRIDLQTFTRTEHEFEDAQGEIAIYPSPDGQGVFYFEQQTDPEEQTVFGWLDPEDFSRTVLMATTNRLRDETRIAYDREGRTLVYLEADDGMANLTVWRDSQVACSRSVDTYSEKLAVGNVILMASGKSVLATFARANGTNATSYGLLEIPFDEAPAREVILIEEAPMRGEEGVGYFQAALSHDRKTVAIASTYLGVEDKGIKPEDCALFLVELSEPDWMVTKVPIPMPARKSSEGQ
jgi:hypothetical protein